MRSSAFKAYNDLDELTTSSQLQFGLEVYAWLQGTLHDKLEQCCCMA